MSLMHGFRNSCQEEYPGLIDATLGLIFNVHVIPSFDLRHPARKPDKEDPEIGRSEKK